MTKRKEQGSATLELALSIPLIVIMMLLLVQVGGVMMTQLAVQEAARAGARVASVDGPGAAPAAARQATGLNPAKLKVTTRTEGGMIRCSTSFPVAIRMPLTNRVLVSPEVKADVAMPLETAS